MNYLNIGTNYLFKELFMPVKNTTASKPNGGLWLTPHDPKYSYNSWLDYCYENPHLLFFNGFTDLTKLPAVFVTLKPEAKIFNLKTPDDLEYLLKNYPREDGWIDYEKLAKDFDGLEFYSTTTDGIDNPDIKAKLEAFSISSMCLFNPEAIQSFQSVQVIVQHPDNYEMLTFIINIDNEKHYLDQTNEEIFKIIYKIIAFMREHNITENSKGYEIIEKTFTAEIAKAISLLPANAENIPHNADELLIRKAMHSI